MSFIATDVSKRTPSGAPRVADSSVHFTPDGVRGQRHVITINIALLTEGNALLTRAQPPSPVVMESHKHTISNISSRDQHARINIKDQYKGHRKGSTS